MNDKNNFNYDSDFVTFTKNNGGICKFDPFDISFFDEHLGKENLVFIALKNLTATAIIKENIDNAEKKIMEARKKILKKNNFDSNKIVAV